jgi:hypothetical protein
VAVVDEKALGSLVQPSTVVLLESLRKTGHWLDEVLDHAMNEDVLHRRLDGEGAERAKIVNSLLDGALKDRREIIGTGSMHTNRHIPCR